MFELPAIAVVGKVEEVVLGVACLGTDLDGTMMFGDFEFSEDGCED